MQMKEMRKSGKSKKVIITCIVMAVIMLVSSIAIFAATYWDGVGGGNLYVGGSAGKGNTVPSGYDNRATYPIPAVRVSIVNNNTGQTKTGCVHFLAKDDNTFSGRKMLVRKSDNKILNKVDMKNNWNGAFTAIDTGVVSNYGILNLQRMEDQGGEALCNVTSATLKDWGESDANLEIMAAILTNGNRNSSLDTLLEPGDRIIIEALYPMTINNTQYLLTCSEYAAMCAEKLGNVNATAGNTDNKNTISFIGNTLCYYFPNFLRAEGTINGSGLIQNCGIAPAGQIPSGSQATFWELLSKSYGMHIAYTDTRPPKDDTCNLTILERFALLRQDASGNYWVDYEYAPGDNTGKQIYNNSYSVTKGSTIKVGYYSSSRTLAGNEKGDFPIFHYDGSVPAAYHANRWWTADGSNGGSNLSDTFTINGDKVLVITYVPNTVKFIVNEYFDLVYDDGYTVGSMFRPGEVGIQENVWVHTTPFEVLPGTKINISDYISPKTKYNRTDGNWIDFPFEPYTDRNWTEYNYVGSGKTFSTKWNYHFDGSYAVNRTEKNDKLCNPCGYAAFSLLQQFRRGKCGIEGFFDCVNRPEFRHIVRRKLSWGHSGNVFEDPVKMTNCIKTASGSNFGYG